MSPYIGPVTYYVSAWDAAEHTVTAPLVVMELHIQMGRWTFFKGITMQVITVNEEA